MESEQLIKELSEKFIELHRTQLQSCGVPEIYWSNLFHKLREETFDAGNYFQICQRVDEDEEVLGYKAISIKDLDSNDSNGIFLIDHAWTYKVNEARSILLQHENLLERLCSLMNVQLDEDEEETHEQIIEQKTEAVLDKMWKFNQTYKLLTEKLADDERESIWYVMDEFGSSIRHNDKPTVEIKPFCYLPSRTMYSIMWPKKDLKASDELTRDYVYGLKDSFLRKYRLLPWNDEIDNDDLINAVNGDSTYHDEPTMEYFKLGRQDETLPDLSKVDPNAGIIEKTSNVNVYTDLEEVAEHLTDSKFQIVEDINQADIIFIRKHFKDFKDLYDNHPHTLVNQFPYENVITVKDLLAVVCRRVDGSSKWLPETYNLIQELPKFVAYYNHRESDDLDNYWILKPWNLARSIDMTITNNLDQIIRSIETGPKIACKYIYNPVLFNREVGGVKFDIRYIVLLRSIQPLTLYTYKVFWLRFANKPYSLDSFDDYEKHFTVMNYKPTLLKQINYDEFIPEFEAQNPQFKWDDIQTKIFKMIRQVFEGASKEIQPKGLANNPQSRAMYAIDLMLDWRDDTNNNAKTIEPMICEINFMPDCTRACKYHPNFFNDVFNTLFMDNFDHQNVNEI